MNKYQQLEKLAKELITAISEGSHVQEVFIEEKDNFEQHYIVRDNQMKEQYDALATFLYEAPPERKISQIELSAKCSDRCYIRLRDNEGRVVKEHDGYVPSYIPGSYGDYVELFIDVETGIIQNWRVPEDKEFFKRQD